MARKSNESIANRIEAALDEVDRPGTFCASGVVPAAIPGLDVAGVGEIGLPLSADQAKRLKAVCEQAGYGKGTKTLVDTDVRRVWKLAPDRFTLGNPAWPGVIDQVLASVQTALGLEDQKLQAHLYDLLLYEKGSFFLPHKDGEKVDRMVATLVVMLPSTYAGGALVVRHEGREVTVDFSGEAARFQAHYAAFYADCEHEVKPLTSGHRLCLVYNLTLAPAKGKKVSPAVGAPRSGRQVEAIAAALKDWPADTSAPSKLGITLEHQYSRNGLAWDALKGVDAARARVLAEAAERAGCHVHLAQLTLWEMGSAEYDESPRGKRRRRGYDNYDGYDDPEDFVMGEVIDSSLTAKNWRSPDGRRAPFGEMPIEEGEVIPEDALTDVKPKEDFEGYTGNAGMTLQRWYRHAAVFLWPDAHHFDVLCASGARQAVPALNRMVSAWRRATGPAADALHKRCRAFAATILSRWPTNAFGGHGSLGRARKPEARDPFDLVPALRRLNDPALLKRYLRGALVRDVTLRPGRATVLAVTAHGWATMRDELLALFAATNAETIARNVQLLGRLCLAARRRKGEPDEDPARQTCHALSDVILTALAALDTAAANANDWRSARIDRPAVLSRLARSLLAAGLEDLLSRLVAHALAQPRHYPLREASLPAAVAAARWAAANRPADPSPALTSWLAQCRKALEALTAAEPQPPADLRRDADFDAKGEDRTALKKFLLDPNEREARFKMAQHRRSDLEHLIDQAKLDLACETDRRPRPQVLICRKNTASFDRRLKVYREDLERLEAVRAVLGANRVRVRDHGPARRRGR